MHHRTTIRNALVALLSGLTTPTVVYVERRHRVSPTALPAVVVALTDAEAQPGERTMGVGFVVEWVQTLVIEAHAAGVDGDAVAPVLDQIELEIETALGADPTLGDIVELVEPVSSTLEMSDDQDRILGMRSMVYNVTWRAPFGSPDSPEA